ncbi:MAG: chloride channel protein [Actinomycetota bacterium]|nr:chloride channel protein [Actinomycetota bacterium]
MTSSSPSAPPAHEVLGRQALVLAVVLGVVASLFASVYLGVVTAVQEWLWTDLPQDLGWDGLPWWWVLGLMLVGATIVLLAGRLPGGTGQSPLTGLHFNVTPRDAGSFLLAATGSLVFGFVVGPEAPLIIVGTTVAALLLRGRDPKVVQLGMLLGGAAAIGLIFGNPFITAFMFLEFAAMGAVPAVALVPTFVALGTGYLVQVGVGQWSGLAIHPLSVPGVPEYSHETFPDLLAGAAIAIVAGLAAVVVREFGERVAVLAARFRAPVLYGTAIVIAVLAIAISRSQDVPGDLVLFSGETAMGSIMAQTSAVTVLLVILAKCLAYGLSIGGGYRGGPIFPIVYIGVGIAVLATIVVTDLPIGPMAAAAVAAASTVMLRLPFTSALLAVLILGTAGMTIAPFAIIGSVIGFGMRQALDRFDARRAAGSPALGT